MKTYKTIDLLYGGYNGKIFKNNFKNIKTGEIIEQGKYPRLECFYFDETGKNIFENIDDNFKTDSLRQLLNQKWEEMPQPVSFMEAIKSKKKIRVEHPLLNTEYFVLDDMLDKLCRTFLNKDIIDILTNGKWYIKEDEEETTSTDKTKFIEINYKDLRDNERHTKDFATREEYEKWHEENWNYVVING